MVSIKDENIPTTPRKLQLTSNIPVLTPNASASTDTPFFTSSPTKSPLKSPSRRALIFPVPSPIKLSPVRTPKGRAGRISPSRRTVDDLNASAVKKAYRTKISAVLAEEDSVYDDDNVLAKQDLAIAEKIIDESRGDDSDTFVPLYGEDVPLEIDSSDEELSPDVSTKKQKTTRATKEQNTGKKATSQQVQKVKVEDDVQKATGSKRQRAEVIDVSESDDDEEDDEEDDVESTYEDAEDSDVGSLVASSEEDDDDDEPVSDSDEDFGVVPKTRKRGRPPATRSPSGTPTKRTRNRPGVEAESPFVEEKILSIFKQDDELLQIRSPYKPSTKPKEAEPAAVSTDPTLFIEDFESIPIVSGVPDTAEDIARKSKQNRFSKLPVPQGDASGKLPDAYVQTYLKDIDWTHVRESEPIDDRSYFSVGPEGFFDQTRHREKHSVDSLTNVGISLEYSQFKTAVDLLGDIRRKDKDTLKQSYKDLYHQWCFTLSQGFNICFYGVGSKIDIITDFATNYMVSWLQDFYKFKDSERPKILVLNGYHPRCKLRDIIDNLIEILVPESSGLISRNMVEVFPSIMKEAAKLRDPTKPAIPKLILVVHNIDSEALRDERTQVQLSELAKMPEVKLLCSFDNMATPLLWDQFKVENFRFVYYDITTYDPYLLEMSHRDVLSMSKSKKTTNGRGARFVLGALNENSRKIYKILITSQIERIQELNPKSSVQNNKGGIRNAIDFKTFHARCRKEFVTSNEITFRSMLGEFVEHNMCKLVKDEAGTEKLYIPFPLQDMKKLARDLQLK